jgi:hypothetical protein
MYTNRCNYILVSKNIPLYHTLILSIDHRAYRYRPFLLPLNIDPSEAKTFTRFNIVIYQLITISRSIDPGRDTDTLYSCMSIFELVSTSWLHDYFNNDNNMHVYC